MDAGVKARILQKEADARSNPFATRVLHVLDLRGFDGESESIRV